MPIIEIHSLTHRFPDGTQALDGIDLSIEEGEFTIITGANGSGKTTLLKHFNGLLFANSGSVTVCGTEVGKNPTAARRQVGMVFQDPDSQIVGETVYDDVAFGPENLGLVREEIDDRVMQALDAVDLTSAVEKSPHSLSGGQKRRLAIAGVLAMRPSVLVMDEPFSNLDYASTVKVLGQILALHASGSTIIITTHDLEKVVYHARRLVVMEKGRIVEDGDPPSVIASIKRYGVRPPCSILLNQGLTPWEG